MGKTRVSLPSGFSFDAVVRSHGWYDLPPFVYDAPNATLTTSVAVAGRAAAVSFRAVGGRIEAASDALDAPALSRMVKRVFSLDFSLDAFASSVATEPLLSRALSRGGGRILRAPTGFEDAVKVLLTTNCSWQATRGMVSRLIAEAGPGGRAFPTPAQVAKLSPARLRSRIRCGYRAPALARFARRVASGRLRLEDWEDSHVSSEALREAILAERGFGPYAAENILRILGRHDYLALDSWVRKKYRQLYPGRSQSTDRSISRRYARYGAYRGLALWLEMTADWHDGKEKVWP